MTVAEWIEKLKELSQSLEVRITDGFKYHFADITMVCIMLIKDCKVHQ